MGQIVYILIIAILLAEYALDRILDYLNRKNWSHELPADLNGIYDEEKYRTSQEYQKVNTRFSLITGTFSLILILTMLVLNGFAYTDELVRSYTQEPALQAILFFGILMFASDILGLPFALYHTFVIEEKFGFNRITVKTIILDKIKGWLLGGIIGGGLLALFVFFHQHTGSLFWFWMWLVAGIFMILMTMFYSSLIVPLFNKLTPLEEGSLRKAIEEYASKVDFKLTNIYVMDGSKRSSKANAYFSGLGNKKKIVLYDTLIKNHTIPELVSVLAHEVGHYKKKHTRLGLFLSLIQTGIILYLLSLFINNPVLAEALNTQPGGFHIGLLVFGLLFSPVSMLLSLLVNFISRKNEFEADEYAVITSDGPSLGEALKKLSVHHLSNLKPHPAYVFFHYAHPPLLQRLSAINKVHSSKFNT